MREKEFLPNVKNRLHIEELNDMQTRMMGAASEKRDLILLSPTGSGKTLAFILPMLKLLNPPTGRVQAVVIAPSRELVLQIASVIREIARGFKVTALYGGHKVEDEVNSLKIVPDIVVATPGRLLDHANRRNVDLLPVRILVLDEFDKSLELGFESEMKKIIGRMKNVSRIILTSATDLALLPEFLKLNNPLRLDFLGANKNLRKRLSVHRVDSDGRDKLQTLLSLIRSLRADGSRQRSIVFVNHRESADRVFDFLRRNHVSAALYHGGTDQHEREKAVALFNNGTAEVLVATDLAARGLDIEHIGSIIHYHQPLTPETYTHRNGRTARVDAAGDIYVLIGPDEDVKEFVDFDDTFYPDPEAEAVAESAHLSTIRFSAGKKEKLSKGDILGFLVKTGGLEPSEIGKIDVFDHYALAAVESIDPSGLVKRLASEKIKGTRRKIELL